jgi:hypothetical protein
MEKKKPSRKSFSEMPNPHPIITAQALVDKEIALAEKLKRTKTQSYLLLCDVKYKLGKALSKREKEKKYDRVESILIDKNNVYK